MISRSRLSLHARSAQQIERRLRAAIPIARVELHHRSPWELLVATILSAQCTDQRVNQVTPELFKRYPTPETMAGARPCELEAVIKSTGFYKSKAKSLIGCSRALRERFHGEIPASMDDLVSLPGVGRKTANVIRGTAFGKPSVVVDTHVKRVANRLALTRSDDPDQIERDLQQIFSEDQWTSVSHRLLIHGRYVCLARMPRCGVCELYDVCRWKGKRKT